MSPSAATSGERMWSTTRPSRPARAFECWMETLTAREPVRLGLQAKLAVARDAGHPAPAPRAERVRARVPGAGAARRSHRRASRAPGWRCAWIARATRCTGCCRPRSIGLRVRAGGSTSMPPATPNLIGIPQTTAKPPSTHCQAPANPPPSPANPQPATPDLMGIPANPPPSSPQAPRARSPSRPRRRCCRSRMSASATRMAGARSWCSSGSPSSCAAGAALGVLRRAALGQVDAAAPGGRDRAARRWQHPLRRPGHNAALRERARAVAARQG